MAEYIDIVGIKQAVNKGKMQAFVRDGSIYLQCKISGECVKIGDAPAADVAPVVHGRWEQCFEDWRKQIEGDECSACGFQHYGVSVSHYHYCPNCGAKMDGGEENEK